MITQKKEQKQQPYNVLRQGKSPSANIQRENSVADPFAVWLKKRYGLDYNTYRNLPNTVRADYIRQFEKERQHQTTRK